MDNRRHPLTLPGAVRILVTTSQKGGVGKTTVSINLACALAERGARVVLLDADPQGSVGLSLSRKARERPGMRDLLRDGGDLGRAILATRIPNLAVIPAGRPDLDFDEQVQRGIDKGSLDGFFSGVRALDYDIAIIDTAAGIHPMTRCLIGAADSLLIPQQAEPLGMRSLPTMLQALVRLRNEGAAFEIAGILLTMVQHGVRGSESAAADLRRIAPASLVLRTTIPRDEDFLTASERGLPVSRIQKRPGPASLAFNQLAAELEPRLGLHNPDTDDDAAGFMD